jgi:hypothetical protein
MALWLPILLVVLVFSCGRKSATGRRCDLGFVVVILSVALLLAQLQPPG